MILILLTYLNECRPTEQILKRMMEDQTMYYQIKIHLSGEQLAKLRKLAGGNTVTIQDALTAYLISTLNTHFYPNDDPRHIIHTSTFMNIRGVSDSIAPAGLVANALFIMLSDDFDDPLSLSNIAEIIRRSIVRARDPKFLESCLATADGQMRRMLQNNLLANMVFFSNDIFVNSNYRYDWANLVDFGYTDKCRYYTAWAGRLCVRIFPVNPIYDGTQWITRDRERVEVAFLIEKDIKDKFIKTWQQDLNEDFQKVKKYIIHLITINKRNISIYMSSSAIQTHS